MYQCLLMILLSLSTLAYAKTDNNMSLEDIAKTAATANRTAS